MPLKQCITITITGPRGSGKSVLAHYLVKFLKMIGFEAHYEGFCGGHSGSMETVAKMDRSKTRFVIEDNYIDPEG